MNQTAKARPAKTLSPKVLKAAKAFKGIKIAPLPAKLRTKKTAAIERAVRRYYLG